MCIDILRNPGKAFTQAKKKKNLGKSLLILIESSVLFALAALVIALSLGQAMLALGAAVSVFVIVFVFGIVFSYVVQIAAVTLGGKGRYFEGLTVVSYSLAPMSAGIFIASLLFVIPFVGIVGALVMAVLFALGLAALYRGIKDMFSVDLITSLIVVSVVTISFIIAIYAYVGLGILSSIGTLIPGI